MALQNVIGGASGAGLVASGISAAGTTQGTATELTSEDNEVSTVASGAGVVLNRLLTAGEVHTVFNSGANALKVYPPSGMSINALTVNAGMLLPTNTGCFFKCVSSTRVFGVLSA